MAHNSWTHRLARAMVGSLIGSGLTPNHLTTARLLTGLAACAAFAAGSRSCEIWGGVLWIISAFLDRADGELARLGNMMSRNGHVFDLVSDVMVNSLVFLAIGTGMRHSAWGGWALVFGIAAGTSIAVAAILSEVLERRQASSQKAWEGRGGFDFDDVLYLFGPVAWLGWLGPLLIGATVGGPVFAVWTWLRLRQIPGPGSSGA